MKVTDFVLQTGEPMLLDFQRRKGGFTGLTNTDDYRITNGTESVEIKMENHNHCTTKSFTKARQDTLPKKCSSVGSRPPLQIGQQLLGLQTRTAVVPARILTAEQLQRLR